MRDDDRLRPSGPPPYWAPGTHIWWHYRRPEWQPGVPEHVAPVRVIHDDADGLVTWLAPKTPMLRAVLDDGRDLRSISLDQRYTAPRAQGRTTWKGNGVLQIAPTGRPWSVWLFWDDGWLFRNWYVNLEDPHVRDSRNVFSQDHVLDLEVFPDRTVRWKDEDELAAAVVACRYTADDAARFYEQAHDMEERVARWESPFCDGWETWRPDPGWPLPDLLW